MKILVTGVAGQLGYDVIKVLKQRNIECFGTDIAEFDITDFNATNAFITEYHPDAIIHCAAYTAVDKAEDNQEICQAVNVRGTENIAKVCKAIGAKMMYISTDYVFPGTGEKYYEVDDPTGPLSVYGQTKLDGENTVRSIINKHFIVRISWVFGKNGNNFVKTMLRLGKEREEVNVVCDQIGSPTYTADLAPLLCDMVVTEKYGTYHAANEGVCSWAEFAEEIFRQAGY
ncbi:MAG: dTDP-4-dehydrorhamnose reductase, partial [Negativicutes bacterium]